MQRDGSKFHDAGWASLITTSASAQGVPCPQTSKRDPCSPCRSITAR